MYLPLGKPTYNFYIYFHFDYGVVDAFNYIIMHRGSVGWRYECRILKDMERNSYGMLRGNIATIIWKD
jgi:hypothetical protein